MKFAPVAAAAFCTLLTLGPVSAQAPGVPIEDQSIEGRAAEEARIIAAARALREAGKLLDGPAVEAQRKAPAGAAPTLPGPQSVPLDPAEIARRARAASVRLGWVYLCRECDEWHANLAGGYALTTGGVVATCAHVVAPEPDMKEGVFIALNAGGEVLAVKSVLACDDEMDAAVVEVDGTFPALPLTEQVNPGDPAWCLSDPFGQIGYFSEGIVNRFYWTASPGADVRALSAVRHLRLNVGTDWAPGSSGSPVLDRCGNAIGHVAVIAPLSDGAPELVGSEPAGEEPAGNSAEGRKRAPRVTMEDVEDAVPLITLHEAVPARSLRVLLGQPAPTAEGTKPE